MRKISLLFLMLWLVGCSSYVRVRVSDGAGDYSIYRNGELVCSASDACTIESTAESEMYLEAKKIMLFMVPLMYIDKSKKLTTVVMMNAIGLWGKRRKRKGKSLKLGIDR